MNTVLIVLSIPPHDSLRPSIARLTIPSAFTNDSILDSKLHRRHGMDGGAPVDYHILVLVDNTSTMNRSRTAYQHEHCLDCVFKPFGH
jgi:hypothetical protein